GYRYQRSEQAGEILHGSSPANADAIATQGCGQSECFMVPASMTMNMHMLDLMYASTDWLTLMLMPQWTDMAMTMDLIGSLNVGHHGGGGSQGIHAHQTGGIGDTGFYALFKLFEHPHHQVVLSLGGTAPTGAIDMKVRRNSRESYGNTPEETPLQYDMQLGSGTWDLKPSLTYSGAISDVAWGAQATGTKRLDRNSQHYALGDMFQGSVWGGYQLTNWLSTTVRGIYTWQDQIRGEFPARVYFDGTSTTYPETVEHLGPYSLTSNYGGRFVDLGLGVNVTVPSGTFAGNTIKFEWLQPLHTDYNGYQLDRDGALTATWGVEF
ncbi:MAG: hypothetical protein U1E13_08915, partial [Methylophilaceae bacterium]|nr:hypothetical protein [Methylophilaceae bacterium]